MNKKIICDKIEIKGSITRHEIVQKVVNKFINTEYEARGSGVKFHYPVEKLHKNVQLSLEEQDLFIIRPAGLRKWNFDFKVNVMSELRLGKGSHEEIKMDLISKKQENPLKFNKLLETLTSIYECSENDVDKLLEKNPDLATSFQSGAQVDVLLKVIKWMFIMEDIVYWNYLGRTKLYNYLKEV
jgi:hypothetical protein